MELEIRNRLVEENLSSVDMTLSKWDKRRPDYDDYYQILSLKLIELVEKFKPSKGVKFSTFAHLPLKYEIIRTSILKQAENFPTTEIPDNFAKPEKRDTFLDLFSETLPFTEKRIVDMKLEGYNNDEISEELELTKCQLRRLIKNIYEKARNYAKEENLMGK